MAKADTPAPADKDKEITPPAGTDTPADKPEGDPAPSAPQQGDERVKELEGQVEDLTNQLSKQETIAKTAQRSERQHLLIMQRVNATLKKIRSGEISPDEIDEPEVPVSDQNQKVVHLEIQNKVSGMILDEPSYQEALKADPTLKRILTKNPLALIDDFIDSEDAATQIKDVLDGRVAELEKAKQPPAGDKGEGEGEGGPPEVDPGAVQPAPVDEGADKPESPQPVGPDGAAVDKIQDSIRSRIKVV